MVGGRFPTFAERKRRLYEVWTQEADAFEKASPIEVRQRLIQVVRYCAAHYPLAYPVSLRVERGAIQSDGKYLAGESWGFKRRFYLRVNPEHPKLSLMIDTAVHEYAHLRVTKHAAVERQDLSVSHSPEWGIAYAQIYSDFFDHDEDPDYLGGAWEASKEF